MESVLVEKFLSEGQRLLEESIKLQQETYGFNDDVSDAILAVYKDNHYTLRMLEALERNLDEDTLNTYLQMYTATGEDGGITNEMFTKVAIAIQGDEGIDQLESDIKESLAGIVTVVE